MAKFIPSALIVSIHGALHGTTLRRCFRGFFSSPRRKPADKRTRRQAGIRRMFSYLAPKWYRLSTAQREGWDDYGGNYTPRLTGYNTFMKLNARLIAASYTTLVLACTAPTEPETPLHLENLRSFEISASQNAIGWRAPLDPALYVSLYRSTEPGFSYTAKRRWSLVETQPTHNGQIIDTHAQPPGTRITYRILITDPDGRQPPPTEVTQPYDTPSAYVSDQMNNRIEEYGIPALDLRDTFEPIPAPGDLTTWPWGIAADTTHLYIANRYTKAVMKFNRFNFRFVTSITLPNEPYHLSLDDTHLFVSIPTTDQVQKRLKSDLSLVATYTNVAPGAPSGIDVDDTYLYVATGSGSQLQRVTKSTMVFFDSYGSQGSGDAQFWYPYDLCVDDTHIFVSDTYNHRIKKHLKSNYAFVAKIGTQGTADNQFDLPDGITAKNGYLLIADTDNERLKIHRSSNLSFYAKTGAFGHSREAFSQPRQAATVQ